MSRSKPTPIKSMTYTASTLQDVLDIVFFLKDTLKTPLWFRGQGVYYNLVPSIIRHAKPIKDWKGEKWTGSPPLRSSGNMYAFPDQFQMLNEFKKVSSHLFKEQPQNTYEWLCIMQHYGIPTKLLDWTVDPMIALFFATDIEESEISRRQKEEEYGAEFWIIAPVMLNSSSMFINQNRIFPSDDNHVEAFMRDSDQLPPIAIDAPKIEERLILQKCCFTMHGFDIRPLNYMWHHEEGFIYKIEIEATFLHELKEILISFGHTHNYYYPNDESKYRLIQKKEIAKFLARYENYCDDPSEINFSY